VAYWLPLFTLTGWREPATRYGGVGRDDGRCGSKFDNCLRPYHSSWTLSHLWVHCVGSYKYRHMYVQEPHHHHSGLCLPVPTSRAYHGEQLETEAASTWVDINRLARWEVLVYPTRPHLAN